MISITERPAKHVPGETSFWVQFDYDQRIYNSIKELDCAYWHNKCKTWEIPLCCYDMMMDNFTKFGEVNLTTLTNTIEETPKLDITTNFKITPLKHQEDGIRYGINHKNWLLLDLPGCGKTLTSIYIAQELKAQGKIEHCLVICGINTLKWNWTKEISKTSDLSYTILGSKISKRGKIKDGSVKERLEHLRSKIDEFFIITNIETLRNSEIQAELKKNSNNIGMVIFDEIHVIKGTETAQSIGALSVMNYEYKLGMTGTVLVNNPMDLYMPLKWIGVEKSAMSTFESTFCVKNEYTHQILGYRNTDYLKYLLSKYSLRRSIELPVLQIIPEYLEMEPSQAKLYKDLESGVVDEIDKVQINTTTILSMLTRLRQASSCPSMLTSTNVKNTKFERVLDLCDSLVSNNQKVVIFSTFKQPIHELAQLLKKFNCVVATGDESDFEISNNIDKFQNDPNVKIFLGTWQKCGTGITLNAASYMIFIDTPWTYAVFDQSCKRIHRIGTTKPSFVYNLICADTVDECVWDILSTKKVLSAYFSDDICEDILSPEELESLYKFILDLRKK